MMRGVPRIPKRPAPTAVQVQTLELVAQGLSHQEIADRLGLKYQAVANRVARARESLGVATIPAAIAEAERRGLLGGAR